MLAQNITVRSVNIVSHGPNSDGCDPESRRDVLIENTKFDTGDDCIHIKSVRKNDVRRLRGFDRSVIDDFRISNSTFSGIAATEVIQPAGTITLDNVNIISPKPTRSANTMPAPAR